MSVQAVTASRPVAIVAIGILTGLIAAVSFTLVRPVVFAFALGGVVVLIPTLLVRDQKAYWLFLLVLSFPFDVSKRMTTWLVDPFAELRHSGPPISGTVSLDIYLTDVVLFAMFLPWLLRLCFRWEKFYFPKIAYIIVIYLIWALIVLLAQGDRLYLAMFEWCRQLLYFLSFIYIINNVVTQSQFRAIIASLMLGLVIGTAAVITLFYFGVGMETNILSGIYAQKDVGHDFRKDLPGGEIHAEGDGSERHTKRSSGLFESPALAAYHLEYCLPIALALVLVGGTVARALFGALFAAGCVALYLTFSRSGLAGFLFGLPAFFVAAWRSGLTSRRVLRRFVLLFVLVTALSAPAVIWSVETRWGTAVFRLELLRDNLDTYLQGSTIGVGFGASNEGARRSVPGSPGMILLRASHNLYVTLLTAVGPVGLLLFLGFFWQVVKIAFRSMQMAEAEMKPLLVGIVGALASIAVHNLGDAFGGHVTHAMLWLFAGLIIATARRLQSERALRSRAHSEGIMA